MAVAREKVVHNAEKYVSRGKIEAAIKEYRKLLADNPNDISTLNRVGDLYARIDRNSEAIDLFHQIAQQYADDGFFVKAIAIYKKIIKLDPTLLEVYEQLADLYHRQGLVNEARTQYQVLADYYLKHDRTTQAVGICRRMVELEPDDPAHRAKLADLYRQEGQVDEAMGEYRAIAELMLQHRRGQEAAQVYERALDVTAEDMGFITDAVLKLKEEGHVGAAAHFLSVAVERNPKAEKVARIAGLEGRGKPAADGPDTAPVDTAALDAETGEPAGAVADAGAEDALPGQESPGGDGAAAQPPPPAPGEVAAPRAPAQEGPSGEGPEEPAAGELFALELDEEEPESLVTPPADMLEDRGRRGAAWSDDAPGERPPAGGDAPGAASVPEAGAAEEPTGAAAEDGPGGTFEFELDLDAGDDELLGAAWATPTGPAATPEGDGDGAPADGDDGLDHEFLERTAAQVQAAATPGEPDDLLTEAEVLAKYGIEEKALDRLAELLQREPGNLEAFRLMVGIHLDAERHDRVAAVAGQMAEAAEAQGDGEVWPEVRTRLEAAGFSVAPGHVESPAPGAATTSADEGAEPAARGEEAEVELSLDDEGFELPEVDVDAGEPETAPPAEAPEPAEPSAAAAGQRPPRRRPDLDAAIAEIDGLVGARKPRKRPPAEGAPAEPAAAEATGPAAEVPDAGGQPPASREPPPPATAEPPAAGGLDPLRALGESLREEIDQGPSRPTPAAEGPGGDGAAAEQPAQDPDDTGMSWLDEVDEGQDEPAALEDEGDFFDLGAELEQELSAEGSLGGDELVGGPAEQSLDDIVEGFKRGVAENLSEEDHDTHFNLGIAYREMGLLDEAIGEFQLAAKSPDYLVACASMLGLCFREKGLPELAVKWYERGLEAPGLSDEDRSGLLYDLGEAKLAAGDREAAYRAFVDLYGVNTNYRDVVARLAELEPQR